MFAARDRDVFGFLKSGLDAHTMGMKAAHQLMLDCGYRAVQAPECICRASERLEERDAADEFAGWIRSAGITVLEMSYRLDPAAGAEWFGRVVEFAQRARLFTDQGGTVRHLFFAGLPETCRRVRSVWGERVDVFPGGETPRETLVKTGVPASRLPHSVVANSVYDEARLAFGRDLISSGFHMTVKPYDRSGYDGFGTDQDSLERRLAFARAHNELPLFRAHMGPYLNDRIEAVQQFLNWTKRLARSGFLDILSIGTSQLTQAAFGEDWGGRPNGGGVPINSEQEYRMAWEAARPMLVRTYAGTCNLATLADMYNRTINNAWHALSLWWFCKIDGRGEYSLMDNLVEQFRALAVVAASGKPFEPNVPHHFAFRGSDDVSYVVSAVLATRVARRCGIKTMVLQNMLNNPSNTWGIQDLAKARSMLKLTKELETDSFRIVYQPRTGLGYFAPDIEKAKVQLAAATALMDDVDPFNELTPDIIHVVSYSEAVCLATPEIIDESIQITRAALSEYRRLRRKGLVDDMSNNAEVADREADLTASARKILSAIDATIPNVETPVGLYHVFRAGFLPVPDLLYCRDEFPGAVAWKTHFVNGGYRIVSESGEMVAPADFTQRILEGIGR